MLFISCHTSIYFLKAMKINSSIIKSMLIEQYDSYNAQKSAIVE